MIDWQASKTQFFVNPRLPQVDKEALETVSHDFVRHVCVTTSGSTNLKWVALSKNAILCSAQAVNDHFQSHSEDIWLNPLPLFHVGGLGIDARAHLSGARVIPFGKWEPYTYHTALETSQATLTALVPTQVYDLVVNQIRAPEPLRAVIVGGGPLSDHLYQKGTSLGWNLVPSYGMTECASQVATATVDSPKLSLLNHLEIKFHNGLICLKGPSLLTAYGMIHQNQIEWYDPKQDGWLTTEDKGEMVDSSLHVLGRDSQFVKIGGESVDMNRLEAILDAIKIENVCIHDIALYAASDERLGHVIHLMTNAPSPRAIEPLIDTFHKRTFPFERIRSVKYVKSIPRTPLGKLDRQSLWSGGL